MFYQSNILYAHMTWVQKTCMLKRQSYKCMARKNTVFNKRDGENVGHIIRNLLILNGEF